MAAKTGFLYTYEIGDSLLYARGYTGHPHFKHNNSSILQHLPIQYWSLNLFGGFTSLPCPEVPLDLE